MKMRLLKIALPFFILSLTVATMSVVLLTAKPVEAV